MRAAFLGGVRPAVFQNEKLLQKHPQRSTVRRTIRPRRRLSPPLPAASVDRTVSTSFFTEASMQAALLVSGTFGIRAVSFLYLWQLFAPVAALCYALVQTCGRLSSRPPRTPSFVCVDEWRQCSALSARRLWRRRTAMLQKGKGKGEHNQVMPRVSFCPSSFLF